MNQIIIHPVIREILRNRGNKILSGIQSGILLYLMTTKYEKTVSVFMIPMHRHKQLI